MRKKQIDLDELGRLAKINPTLEEIAAVFDCSHSTVKRRMRDDPEFKEIVERGRNLGKIELRKRLRASDNPSILIFRAKNELGYRDFRQVEVSGADRRPVEVTWLDLIKAEREGQSQ